MADIFRGYLLKAVLTNVVFPLNYIQWDTYESTPNQREEIKAYRDDNTRNLTRVTAQGKKSVIKFKTRDRLHLDDKMFIQKWFGDAEEPTQEAHEQRKVEIEFWDDEENIYKTGYFYRPNMKFQIVHLTDTDIIYKELQFELIEY